MNDAHITAEQYTDQSLSSIHHALRASRRRLVVGLVAHRQISTAELEFDGGATQSKSQNNVTVTVRRLAKEIVSIEEGVCIDHATGDKYHNVYTSLIQTHLPELNDISAIEYDDDRKKLTPDKNLLALSMVAAVSSPIAQMLFHDAVSNIYAGTENISNSSGN